MAPALREGSGVESGARLLTGRVFLLDWEVSAFELELGALRDGHHLLLPSKLVVVNFLKDYSPEAERAPKYQKNVQNEIFLNLREVQSLKSREDIVVGRVKHIQAIPKESPKTGHMGAGTHQVALSGESHWPAPSCR